MPVLPTMATQCKITTISGSRRADSQSSNLPQLSYKFVTTADGKKVALRLVADSIAQQRQVASQAIIFHPLCLAALASVSLLTWWLQCGADMAGIVIMQSGLIITYLAAVQYFTSAYIQRAEAFNWRQWITGPNGHDDEVLVAQYGSEVIGTLVLRLTYGDKGALAPRGEIRAWTTKLKYRNKGIGSDLLHEAVRHAFEVAGTEVEVAFARAHANMPLPQMAMFSGEFQRQERKARNMLLDAIKLVAQNRA